MKVLEELEELEKLINSRLKEADFKFPPEYLDLAFLNRGETERVGNWNIHFSKEYIEITMAHLKERYGIDNLIPFAVHRENLRTACFGTVGKDKGKILIVAPHTTKETMVVGKYKSFEYWLERRKKKYRE